MYCGYWKINNNYMLGDIVSKGSDPEHISYYICIRNHISDNLTFPNNEDIYWLQISSYFITFIKDEGQYDQDNGILPDYFKRDDDKIDEIVNSLVENVIKNEIVTIDTNSKNLFNSPFKIVRPKNEV